MDVITFSNSTGNVGIGMTDPGAYRLNVSGDIRASGNVFAGSDVRFKQAIQPLTDVLGKLDQVQAVSFERSALAQALGQPARGREIGVIGQELEQVFPELVSASGPERYRAVEYGKLTVVLLEAIKELKQQDAEAINALKAKQAALQARLDALEKAQQQR